MSKHTNISRIEHVGVLVNGDVKDSTIQLVGFKACDAKGCSHCVIDGVKYCAECKKKTIEIFGLVFATFSLFIFLGGIVLLS